MSCKPLMETPTFPTSPRARIVVGVVADLGGEVEGNGKTGLPLFDQVVVAPVALCCRAEAGVLAHGPEAAAIHIWLHTTGEREFTGEAEFLHVIGGAFLGRCLL